MPVGKCQQTQHRFNGSLTRRAARLGSQQTRNVNRAPMQPTLEAYGTARRYKQT